MKFVRRIGLMMIVLLTGCSSLHIKTTVYNQAIPVTCEQAMKYAESVVGSGWYSDEEARNKTFDQFMKKYKKQLTCAVGRTKMKLSLSDNCTEVNSKVKNNATIKEELAKILDKIEAKIKTKLWAGYNSDISAIFNAARYVFDRTVICDPRSALAGQDSNAYSELMAKMGANKKKRDNFEDFIIRTTEENVADSTAGLIQIIRHDLVNQISSIDQSGIAASNEMDRKSVGYPIFDPLIAQLDKNEQAWSPFDDLEFRTQLGDSQFVVVREGTLIFRMKSLDFDPTPIIGAGAATAKLGLIIAGAVATGTANIPPQLLPGQKAQVGAEPSSQTDIPNAAETDAAKDLLRRRNQIKAELLRDIAQLHAKVEKEELSPNDFRKEFSSVINFYVGRVGTFK